MPAVNTTMRSKASNSVLNLVHPPIDNMVLLQGVFDDVVIGSHVPNVGFFTDVTVTSLASAPLVGATDTGLLSKVLLGTGLELIIVNGRHVLTRVTPPPLGYGLGIYGADTYGPLTS